MKKFDQKIDLLRVLSMFLVIVIHVSNYYCRANDDISPVSFYIAIVYNILARVAVPIFFMISGALLLNREYDEKKNNQRIFRMVVVLVVSTIVYLIWDQYYLHKTITNSIEILFIPERKMLWFLYVMIGLYIALPFIKVMVDHMDEKLDKKFLCLWLFFNGFLYTVKYFFSFDLKYFVPIINGTYYFGYFIVGHMILKYKDRIDYSKYNSKLNFLMFVNVSLIYFLTVHDSILADDYVDKYLKYR